MAHRRGDVVATAMSVLDRYGLADLTMRRLAAELDVRPSALYHHFPDKQTLLAAVADELLARGRRDLPNGSWRARVASASDAFRDAMLAYRDGAELVATVRGFGLGGAAPYDEIRAELVDAGLDAATATAAAATLVHYVLGHTLQEQTQMQAQSAGAIDGPMDAAGDVGVVTDFRVGLDLILDGISVRLGGVAVTS